MPYIKKEAPRKGELTSMIDMIFLLLIFFLVTLAAGFDKGAAGIDTGRDEGLDAQNLPVTTVKDVQSDSFDLKVLVIVDDNGINGYLLEMKQKTSWVNKKIKELESQCATGNQAACNELEVIKQKKFSLPRLSEASTPADLTLYQNAIDRIATAFDKVRSDMESINRTDIPTIVLELDKDVYYKFITDLNNLFYEKFLKNKIYTPDQTNLKIMVINRNQ